MFFGMLFWLFFQNNLSCQIQSNTIDSVSFYIKNKDFIKGLHLANNLTKKYYSQKNYLAFTEVNIQIAEIYYRLNDHKKALQFLFNAKKTIGNKNILCNILIVRKIGDIYLHLKKYNETKKYFYAALNLSKKSKSDSLVQRMYQKLYQFHIRIESDSVAYYLKLTNKINRKIGTTKSLFTLCNNSFVYYDYVGNYGMVRKYLDSLNYYARKTKVKDKIIIALNNSLYYDVEVKSDFIKGKKEYQELIKLQANDTLSLETAQLYFDFAFDLEKLHEYKQAAFYLKKYIAINKILYSDKTNGEIKDIETKYELNKIESDYKDKQHQLLLQKTKEQRIYVAIISVLAILTLLFYVFEQNTKLKTKNNLNAIQNQMQQNLLNASLDGHDLERKNIANLLHDHISAQLSCAGMQLAAFSASNPIEFDEISKTRAILNDVHNEVRNLSHHLSPTLLTQFGLYFAITDLCEKNSNSLLSFECFENKDQRNRYSDDFEMKIYLIISELFNNIQKHSEATCASVSITEKSNKLIVRVQDNGKGFNPKNYDIEGYGITQIRTRINGMKGAFTIESELKLGTNIEMQLPIPKKN